MIVYIVMHGEQHEGGSIVSVHKTKDGAVEAALSVEACFEGGWQLDGTEPHDLEWINGCDFVRVVSQRVEE